MFLRAEDLSTVFSKDILDAGAIYFYEVLWK